MKSDTGKSSFFQAEVLNAPVALNDVVRRTDMDAAISGTSPTGHTHTASQITDYGDAWRTQAASDLEDSDTNTWASGTGAGTTNKRRVNIKLKASGGLKSSTAGVEVDFGSGTNQAARGDHTHALLHNPLTVNNGNTVAFSLSASQLLSAEVKLKASGGLKSSASGVEVDFGSGTNQVPRGDHTHSLLHAAVTVANSNSLALTVSGGQLVSGSVRRKSGGAILEDANGIYADVGTGATQLAAGNHTHAIATTTADGLLSAADKVKLDTYGQMLQVDQSVPLTRHDAAETGEYVGGKHRWGQAMQVVRWHATANAPVGGPVTLGLQLNGVVVNTMDLAAGVGEATNQSNLTNQHIAADQFARVIVVTGVGTGIENEASRFNVMMEVRPSLATAPTIDINTGGGAVSPFAPDAYYSGGFTQTTATACNTSGVISPAPASVYQSIRYDSTSFNYTVTGLAKGITHTVRLHFNEIQTGGVGARIMRIGVGGVFHADLDVYQKTGAMNKAWIEEYTGINADSNGQLLISFLKIAGGVMISGIEIIPNV